MAPKLSSFFLILSFSLLPLLLRGTLADPHGNSHSPFDFLKHLQGCHKGDKTKGLKDLKKYLKQFGYLKYDHSNHGNNHANDDYFDHDLEAALKNYQHNYHLNATGDLDGTTVSKMMMPRCGVADIIKGNRKAKLRGAGQLNAVSDFSFFPGSPKWSSAQLTYAFLPNTRSDAMGPVADAFDKWASVSNFRFTQVQNAANANIVIGFGRRDHGDGHSFDGPGGTIAHAFAPKDGRFHYDAEESWAVGATPNAFDLETIALHEIGHVLGLGHSMDENAIMFPSIGAGVRKGLNEDDIRGIKTLYNL